MRETSSKSETLVEKTLIALSSAGEDIFPSPNIEIKPLYFQNNLYIFLRISPKQICAKSEK